MLISLVARPARVGERDTERYVGWSAALRRFRDDWDAGKRPGADRLADYLSTVEDDDRPEALQDLIAEHLRRSWESGPGPELEEYGTALRDVCPALGSSSTVPADLVEDEFLARHVPPHGDAPSLSDYESRFPSRPDILVLLRSRCLHGNRYVLHRRIGTGAMGVVWEAFDCRVGRLVAVKTPRPEARRDPEVLSRFCAEARLTAGLDHPGIVGVHDIHLEGEDAPFYVMRLVRGRTFGERIREYHRPAVEPAPGQKRTLWRELVRSFVGVCDAVAHAHACGILHRDLKPGNILVGASGETVILDWGLAGNGEGAGGASEVIAGTPDYMPPEQAEGRAEVRSDVFGLGAVLYEVLTARAPHDWGAGRPRPRGWREDVKQARITPPRRINRRAPRALEAVCLKALSREVCARYPSADALARDVREYLAGGRVSAVRETFIGRIRCLLFGPRGEGMP